MKNILLQHFRIPTFIWEHKNSNEVLSLVWGCRNSSSNNIYSSRKIIKMTCKKDKKGKGIRVTGCGGP
jgi:hypothetical protein